MLTNKIWNNIVWTSLTAISLGCGSTPRQIDELRRLPALRLASDIWPPFTDVSTKPRFALELVHTALDRAGVRAGSDLREDFTDPTDEIRAGDLDGSAALWRSPERETFLLYSRPYLENRLVLVGREGSDVTATTFSDLTGKRVALVESYAYGEAAEGAQGPKFVQGRSDGENLQSLLQGEVDYVLADELLVHHLVQSDEEKAERLLEIGTTALMKRSLHFAIRRDLPRSKQIMDRFDTEIRRMLGDGSYNRILRLAWIRVDVDGDGTPELVLSGRRAGLHPPDGSYDLFAPESTDDREPRYLIESKTYDSWQDVPPRYKRPRRYDRRPREGSGEPGERGGEWGLRF